MTHGSDQSQGYKDPLKCLIIDPTMAGGKENLGFLDALKHSILELILSEKTWKEIQMVFF